MVASGLCKNGHGPFGPTGDGSSLTTPCFNDVVLLPLASFIFIVVLLPASLLLGRRSTGKSIDDLPTLSGLPRWVGILYAVLLVAQAAMMVLEIARLAVANQGVGLLPVTLIGLVFAFPLVLMRHLLRRTSTSLRRSVGLALLGYWTLSIPFEAVKLARLDQLQKQTYGVKGYPSSDKFTDNIVILAIYCIFWIFELVSVRAGRGQRRTSEKI